ncbi:hypothetical protein Q5752_000126 [Cryptotrichosporon argae]
MSSSDEPELLPAPPRAFSSTSRYFDAKPRAGGSSAARSDVVELGDDSDSDSDEVVFVKSLSDRFAFNAPGPSRRPVKREVSTPKKAPARAGRAMSSAPGSVSDRGATASAVAPLPLVAPLDAKPAPVPSWLGKTAVLKPLKRCVVCSFEWKKAESGAAKWRHMSTCRPPLYRPPNPAPDLELLLSAALDPARPTPSLLEHHVETDRPPAVLKRSTTVKRTDERDNWGAEIDERVGANFGHPNEDRHVDEGGARWREEGAVVTQPMGDSELGSAWARPELREVDDEAALLPQVPPPLLSQRDPTPSSPTSLPSFQADPPSPCVREPLSPRQPQSPTPPSTSQKRIGQFATPPRSPSPSSGAENLPPPTQRTPTAPSSPSPPQQPFRARGFQRAGSGLPYTQPAALALAPLSSPASSPLAPSPIRSPRPSSQKRSWSSPVPVTSGHPPSIPRSKRRQLGWLRA